MTLTQKDYQNSFRSWQKCWDRCVRTQGYYFEAGGGSYGFVSTFSFRGEPLDNRCGPGSSVGIATELRAGRSGIESRWGRDFPPVQTGPEAHPAYCTVGTGSFPGVKCGRGVTTIHPI